QKRLRMRDGEEFFAKGRSDATFELVQQQMRKAVAWHRDLRLDTLKSLAGMDRGLVELLRQSGPSKLPAGAYDLSAYGLSTKGFEGGRGVMGGHGGAGGRLKDFSDRRQAPARLARRGDAGEYREEEVDGLDESAAKDGETGSEEGEEAPADEPEEPLAESKEK